MTSKEKQIEQLEELLKEKEAQGYEHGNETYYDPHAGITFGTGKYSNTIVGGGYTVGSGIGLASSSATGYTWTNGTGTTIAANPWATTTSTGKLNLEGDDADIVINGVSLVDILRDRLNVMIPNPKLEKEWDQLKELGDQYRALEAKLKEQGDMWAKLKAMPPPPL